MPTLAQELRVHLAGRTRGHLFESNRHDRYSQRAIHKLIQATAKGAGLERRVYPHPLRHSVAQNPVPHPSAGVTQQLSLLGRLVRVFLPYLTWWLAFLLAGHGQFPSLE